MSKLKLHNRDEQLFLFLTRTSYFGVYTLLPVVEMSNQDPKGAATFTCKVPSAADKTVTPERLRSGEYHCMLVSANCNDIRNLLACNYKGVKLKQMLNAATLFTNIAGLDRPGNDLYLQFFANGYEDVLLKSHASAA